MPSIQYKKHFADNLNILFWLIKDACWLMGLGTLATLMIAPTLIASVWFTRKARHSWPDLAHNLAVTLWICANSWWMVNELFWNDRYTSWSLIPFAAGLLILLLFYVPAVLYWVKRRK